MIITVSSFWDWFVFGFLFCVVASSVTKEIRSFIKGITKDAAEVIAVEQQKLEEESVKKGQELEERLANKRKQKREVL